MTRQAFPTIEFDQEMASTRRLLERVPSDKGEWKPHAKSFYGPTADEKWG